MGTRADKYKLGARVSKYKLGARAGKYKLGTMASQYKLRPGPRARIRAGGQAKGWGPVKHKHPKRKDIDKKKTSYRIIEQTKITEQGDYMLVELVIAVVARINNR